MHNPYVMPEPCDQERCPWKTQIALNEQALTQLQESLDKIEYKIERLISCMDNRFVTKEEFKFVQRIVYGAVGIILFSALISLLALILPNVNA